MKIFFCMKFFFSVSLCFLMPKYDENEELKQPINRFKIQGHKSKTLKKDHTDKPKIKYIKH